MARVGGELGERRHRIDDAERARGTLDQFAARQRLADQVVEERQLERQRAVAGLEHVHRAEQIDGIVPALDLPEDVMAVVGSCA